MRAARPSSSRAPPTGKPIVGAGTTYVVCAGAGADRWYRYHPLFAEAVSAEARRRFSPAALHATNSQMPTSDPATFAEYACKVFGWAFICAAINRPQ